MDLRSTYSANTCDTCDICQTAIYEVIQNNQHKICSLCNVYKKCGCCESNTVSITTSHYPYCVECYLDIRKLSTILPDKVYVTDFYTAQNYKLLDMFGIKQILTIGKELPMHNTDKFKTMYISIDDSPTEDIARHFQDAHSFIHQAPTLVHCYAGISRSISLVISYLIKYENMSLNMALNYCRRGRPHANPNYGFLKQLYEYELMVKNSSKAL